MTRQDRLYEAILNGEHETAAVAVREALQAGASPLDVIADGISPAMKEAGRLFEESEYFVPELLMCARATKSAFEILRPLLAGTGAPPAGRVVLGTVRGDMHDIGKNLVGVMLEGAGFEVTDIGVDAAPEQFVEAVRIRSAHVVGLSAMLTTTMPSMPAVLEALRAADLRDRVKVMIGGSPVTAAFAHEIGADGFAESAAAAVGEARRLVAALGSTGG